MKLITLWEPWATLMAIGAKKIETRSWGTPYRGWLAIHAAKRFTADEDFISWTSPFREALKIAGVPDAPYRSGRRFQFPLGCIIAVAKLTDCKRVGGDQSWRERPDFFMQEPPSPELEFGNYEPGRYGLITDSVFRLPQPIPYKSRQGTLLDLEPEIVEQIQKQWKEAKECATS